MKQFAMIGTYAERIAKVVQVIERDFNQPLTIGMVSATVNMSPSSLHHHFKEITAMSPLQYQKQVSSPTLAIRDDTSSGCWISSGL